jgi:2-oxoglutarate ferredoxin oxidoreductase subunit alpha
MTNDLVIGMAGAGGDGVVSAGESLIAAAAEIGYHAILTKSFGPQIRGGESSCRLRLSTAPVLNPGAPLDVAVALNWGRLPALRGRAAGGRRDPRRLRQRERCRS